MNDIMDQEEAMKRNQAELLEQQSKELSAKVYPKEYYDLLLKPGQNFKIKITKAFLDNYTTGENYQDFFNIDNIPDTLDIFRNKCGSSVNTAYIRKSDWIGKEVELFKIKEIFPLGNKIFKIITTGNKALLVDLKNVIESKGYIAKDTDMAFQQVFEGEIGNRIKVMDTWKVVSIKKDSKNVNIPGENFSILDKAKNRIMTHDGGCINLIDINEDLSYKQIQTEDVSMRGNLKLAMLDNKRNFVICIFESEDVETPDKKKSYLKIFQFDHGVDLTDPKSPSVLIEQETIPDIQEIMYIDDNDDIIVLDSDYQVRRIQTNMQEFPEGYTGRAKFSKEGVKVRKAVNKTLEDAASAISKGITIDTAELETQDEDVDMAKLRKQVWDMPFKDFDDKTLKELFDTSETVDDLLKVKSIVDAIKRTPEIAAIHGLLDPIESTIFKKYNQARLDEMYERLDNLAASLGEGEDFNTLVYIQSSLKEIQKDRAHITNIAPTAKDKEIKELAQVVDQKISEYRESHQEDIQTKIDENLAKIKEYLSDIEYMPQITSIYSQDIRKRTEEMNDYLDDASKKANKEAMKALVKTRQNQLQKELIDIQKQSLAQEQLKVDEIKESIGQIKEIIATINDEEAIKDMEKNDSLVAAIRKSIDDISVAKGQELLVQLDNAFKERILGVKYSKDTTKKWVKTLDKYGIPNSLYHVPDINKKVKRELMGKQVGDKIKIYFESNTWVKIEPDINKKILGNFPFQVTQEEFIEIKKYLGERRSNGKKKEFKGLIAKANAIREELGDQAQADEAYKKVMEDMDTLDKKYYIPRMLEVMDAISGGLRDMSDRPRVPSLNSKTVIGESVTKFLSKMGRLLDQQMKYKEWFVIVESEAGTGKNFKMDILAHLTNREIFHISCNGSMEKEDILFSPEISNEGTFRQKSELIKGLQTPGAIILLDEINTLRPSVAKLLNPLLAGQRYINDPQLGRFYAHPSVVIVGLMNPRYYLGTSDLAPEFADRARFMNDEYAPPMEEWYMISKYMDDSIAQMTTEEFNHFRDKYIVKKEVPNDKKIYNGFIAISKTVELANRFREIYSKTMRGEIDMDKEIKLIFSSRWGNFIIQDYNETKDIKKSMEDVILPKITDHEQKKRAQAVIDDVCR